MVVSAVWETGWVSTAIAGAAGRRHGGDGPAGGSSGHAGVRLLSALLTEMDGMELATGDARLAW